MRAWLMIPMYCWRLWHEEWYLDPQVVCSAPCEQVAQTAGVYNATGNKMSHSEPLAQASSAHAAYCSLLS